MIRFARRGAAHLLRRVEYDAWSWLTRRDAARGLQPIGTESRDRKERAVFVVALGLYRWTEGMPFFRGGEFRYFWHGRWA